MAYTLPTNWTENITGMYTLFKYVQDVSLGYFFPMILFALFVIIFIALKGYSASRAFAGSSFFTMVMSVMLTMLGFLASTWMYLSFIAVAVSIVILHLENAKE